MTKSTRPDRKHGNRLCITVTKQGVTAYGNKVAFESLAEIFKWLASSAASEHYECHTILSLQDEASLLDGQKPKNVFALFDKEAQAVFARQTEESFGFELTFMMATETELNELDALQEVGRLPESWNSEGS